MTLNDSLEKPFVTFLHILQILYAPQCSWSSNCEKKYCIHYMQMVNLQLSHLLCYSLTVYICQSMCVWKCVVCDREQQAGRQTRRDRLEMLPSWRSCASIFVFGGIFFNISPNQHQPIETRRSKFLYLHFVYGYVLLVHFIEEIQSCDRATRKFIQNKTWTNMHQRALKRKKTCNNTTVGNTPRGFN